MKRSSAVAMKAGDVIDAKSFSNLMIDTYRKNLEIRQRKERSKKNSF